MPWDKTRWRTETAIRLALINPGLTDAEIAEHVGLTHAGYTQLKRRPEYKQIYTQLTTGILSSIDAELGSDIKNLRERLKSTVPVALQHLADLLNNNDPKIKLQAIKETLDRDGRFASVTRVGLPTEEQGGFISKADHDIASALLGAVGKDKVSAKN